MTSRSRRDELVLLVLGRWIGRDACWLHCMSCMGLVGCRWFILSIFLPSPKTVWPRCEGTKNCRRNFWIYDTSLSRSFILVNSLWHPFSLNNRKDRPSRRPNFYISKPLIRFPEQDLPVPLSLSRALWIVSIFKSENLFRSAKQ